MTIKSSKTNEEMAQVFYRVGLWFDSLPSKSKVRMTVGNSKAEVGDCNTPACFGGWLSVMFGTEIYNNPSSRFHGTRGYNDGADEFAKELGFVDYDQIRDWASQNPHYWGNRWGRGIFSCVMAFNEEGGYTYIDGITVKDIANKLLAVAKRLDKDVEIRFAKKDTVIPKITVNTKQKVC